MNKIINIAYPRFGYLVGFLLGSLFLYYYVWHGITDNYGMNTLIFMTCLLAGTFGGVFASLIVIKLAPEYNPYSNLDDLVLDIWHCAANSVLFWIIPSFFHFILSVKPDSYLNNPDFPVIKFGLLILGMGIIMGIGFSIVKITSGILEIDVLSIFGPYIVGIAVGALQGYLFGSSFLGIPKSIFLLSITQRIAIGTGLSIPITYFAYSRAILTKQKDLHKVSQIL